MYGGCHGSGRLHLEALLELENVIVQKHALLDCLHVHGSIVGYYIAACELFMIMTC